MTQTTELLFSDEAEATRAVLFQGQNSINFYVEDKNKEYEYETILRNLLGNEYRIRAVFSANGKPGVKERYEEFGSETEGVRNFYIVDGDLDRYTFPEEMIDDECFIYLEPYNIENHFIDEEATILYIQGKKRTRYEETKALIDFVTWKDRIVTEASELYLLHCYVQKVKLGIPNTKRSAYSFIDESGFKKENSIDDYRKEIEAISQIDSGILDEIRSNYFAINGEDYFNLICGKFLFSSLSKYLCGKTGVNISYTDFRWFLITHLNLEKIDYIKRRIVIN